MASLINAIVWVTIILCFGGATLTGTVDPADGPVEVGDLVYNTSRPPPSATHNKGILPIWFIPVAAITCAAVFLSVLCCFKTCYCHTACTKNCYCHTGFGRGVNAPQTRSNA